MKRSADHHGVMALRYVRRKQTGKSEVRSPKSERRPESESQEHARARGQRNEKPLNVLGCRSQGPKALSAATFTTPFRTSDFGLASDFGLRTSDFCPPVPDRLNRRGLGLLCRLFPLLFVFASVCFGQGHIEPRPAPLDPVEAVQQARALVSDMLTERPDQNVTNTGRVTIRDAEGRERVIPVRFEVTATPTGWESVYETLPSAGSPGGTRLTVIHSGAQPNRYELIKPAAPGATNAVAQVLAQDQIMAPFAGSDFWIADLGLEFLHWPKQRLLRKEMRHSKFCYVLESVNPQPVPGGYSRVVSWLIFDPPHGIVHADAYNTRGERIKQFDPKNLEKVQGEYQLESMEIRSGRAGTRTVIEFDLEDKAAAK
jgi:Outer membrane lipoprotein-sorting protein